MRAVYYLSSIFKLLTRFHRPWLILRVFTGKTSPGIFQVSLRGSGLRFFVRGAMDIWSIKETFLDRFYERFGTPIGENWTIVDIGAGLGDFTIFALQRPGCQVFAFEPFHESFELMVKNLGLNGAQTTQVCDLAIAGRSGQVALDASGGEPLQIQSLGRAPDSKGTPILVDSLTLEDAFERYAVPTCHLLKLDCEGAEYEILFNASQATLERVQRIVMEYHDGLTPYNHAHLESFLQARGYQTRRTPNYVHEHLGYLYASRV